jgi:carbon-monoxide dehydrogenase large subunit
LTEQLKDRLAAQFKVPAELVVFKDGNFVAGGQALDFLETTKKTMKAGQQIVTYGWYETQGGTGWAHPGIFWIYGAYGVTVKVDSQTGRINVLKIAVAQDVGKAMDRTLTELQLVGGAVQGMGNTLYEELKFSEKGAILNPNFRDYAIPSSTDLPEVIPIIVETPHPEGPKGAKGVGEGPLVAVQAAIANAIYDATGKRFKDFPITPEKIAMME